jgi:hypothetical protein
MVNGSISTTVTEPSEIPVSKIRTASPSAAATGEAVGKPGAEVAGAVVAGSNVAGGSVVAEPNGWPDGGDDVSPGTVCWAAASVGAAGRGCGWERTSKTAAATSKPTDGPIRRQSGARRVRDLLSWATASLAGTLPRKLDA